MVESLMIALSVVVVPASLALWIAAAVRTFIHRQPLLPWTVRQAVPWTLIDMLFIGTFGIAAIGVSSVAMVLVYPELKGLSPEQYSIDHHIATIVLFSFSSTLVGLFGLLVLRVRAGASIFDLGLSPPQLRQDLYLGGVAFVMLVVPMLTIQFVANQLLDTDQRHMFIELILDNPNPYILLPIAFAAVVVAPIVEEFLFRLLLQGWLERLCTPSYERPAVVADLAEDESVKIIGSEAIAEQLDGPQAGGPHDWDAAAYDAGETPDSVTRLAASLDGGTRYEPSIERRWLPIAVSSAAFSVAHFGQGAAPIALFFLALGLGYVYQRTHRILPCIAIHFLVNLLALVQLAAYIIEES